eukprot:403355920
MFGNNQDSNLTQGFSFGQNNKMAQNKQFGLTGSFLNQNANSNRLSNLSNMFPKAGGIGNLSNRSSLNQTFGNNYTFGQINNPTDAQRNNTDSVMLKVNDQSDSNQAVPFDNNSTNGGQGVPDDEMSRQDYYNPKNYSGPVFTQFD